MKDATKVGVKHKKPYTKPEVKQIPLRPDEAVLGACKVSGGGGPGSTCAIGFCSIAGS